MHIEGTVTFAGANKNNGYYSIAVKTAEKDLWVSFGIKASTHQIGGVTVEKGMFFSGEVEGQYNKFVSGTVTAPKKETSVSGSKGGYDSVGPAAGGAVNRANDLIAAKLLDPVGAGSVSVAQYMWSEMLAEAARTKRLSEFSKITNGVNILDLPSLAPIYIRFMGLGGNTEQTAPVVNQTPAPAPTPAAEATLPPDFMGTEGSSLEDDVPF